MLLHSDELWYEKFVFMEPYSLVRNGAKDKPGWCNARAMQGNPTPTNALHYLIIIIIIIIIIIFIIVIIIVITTMVSGECELYREACEDGVLPGETILAYHGVCREKPCSKSKYFDLLNQIKWLSTRLRNNSCLSWSLSRKTPLTKMNRPFDIFTFKINIKILRNILLTKVLRY